MISTEAANQVIVAQKTEGFCPTIQKFPFISITLPIDVEVMKWILHLLDIIATKCSHFDSKLDIGTIERIFVFVVHII